MRYQSDLQSFKRTTNHSCFASDWLALPHIAWQTWQTIRIYNSSAHNRACICDGVCCEANSESCSRRSLAFRWVQFLPFFTLTEDFPANWENNGKWNFDGGKSTENLIKKFPKFGGRVSSKLLYRSRVLRSQYLIWASLVMIVKHVCVCVTRVWWEI